MATQRRQRIVDATWEAAQSGCMVKVIVDIKINIGFSQVPELSITRKPKNQET
jgi:hypothetical protein